MARAPDNTPIGDGWLDRLPIDIDTLAALVEGDLDSREADEVRERLLTADPELAHRVEMMCQDRVVVRTLGDELPPAGLAEAVIARLEREALVGLAESGAGGATIPVSRVLTHQPGRWAGARRWLTSPAGAGLALAAALALAVGVGIQLLPSRSPGVPTPDPMGPIALESAVPDDRGAPPEAMASKAVVAPEVPDAPAQLATAEAEHPAPSAEVYITDDLDRVLTLMAEGRLLVRVRSVEPTETAAQLARLVGRTDRPGEAWRLDDEVTEPVAVAMEIKFSPMVSERGPTVFADGERTGGSEAAPQRTRQQPSALEAVYLADTRADRAALLALRAALSLGDGQVAVFEELPEPLELPRVFTPDAVLWWGRPAGEWADRGFVPVVIERVERVER
ncbi:MAG: hypothetical protein IT431_09800 [Phycisphaerales bacterium]|nr:hypothetical protein [Phycisphaerales bacterium]